MGGYPLGFHGGDILGMLLNIDNTECIYIEVSRYIGFIEYELWELWKMGG
jgi:hypothetical protein